MILSCAGFQVGDAYHVFSGGVQMAYTGTDVMRHPGKMPPGEGGQRPEGGFIIPEDREPGNMPQPPEGDYTIPSQPGTDIPAAPQGTPPTWPEGETIPLPSGEMPTWSGANGNQIGEPQILFCMQDKVNFFTGLIPVQ